MAGKKNVKKKVRKAVSHGKCFVQAGFGNTIITMRRFPELEFYNP